MKQASTKAVVLMALAFFLFGGFFLAAMLGVLPAKASIDNPPLAVQLSAAAIFLLSGVLVLLVGLPGAENPERVRWRGVLSWFFVFAMAVVFNWISFGRGPRHFSGGVSVGAIATHGSASEWEGRILFGFCSLMMDFLLIAIPLRAMLPKKEKAETRA
jgi:hypothetical protein